LLLVWAGTLAAMLAFIGGEYRARSAVDRALGEAGGRRVVLDD
jgi:hypothetical protein